MARRSGHRITTKSSATAAIGNIARKDKATLFIMCWVIKSQAGRKIHRLMRS